MAKGLLPSPPVLPFQAEFRTPPVLAPTRSEAGTDYRFSDYPGRYGFHCHNLEHEDDAMMAQFEVRSAT